MRSYVTLLLVGVNVGKSLWLEIVEWGPKSHYHVDSKHAFIEVEQSRAGRHQNNGGYKRWLYSYNYPNDCYDDHCTRIRMPITFVWKLLEIKIDPLCNFL